MTTQYLFNEMLFSSMPWPTYVRLAGAHRQVNFANVYLSRMGA